MIKLYKYSKRLHWVCLCCFLLPFFHYSGCESAEEKATAEAARSKMVSDSIVAKDSVTDTTAILNSSESTKKISSDTIINVSNDSISQNNSLQTDTSKERVSSLQKDSISKRDNKSDNPSEKISYMFPFLKPVLNPEPDTYTGVATIVDSIIFVYCVGMLSISFLLLFTGLIIKYIDKNARKAILFIDIMALLFLLYSHPTIKDILVKYEKLWGFKCAIILVSVLTIYDFYIVRKIKKEFKADI